MPYARFDDRWDDHKKIKRALRREPLAALMHAMAITYCSRHNNDGEVDSEWIEEKFDAIKLRPRQRDAILSVMLELKLFVRTDDETYEVHDFLDWNLSSAQRKALSEQGRRGGSTKPGHKPTGTDGSSHGLSEGQSEGLSTPSPTPTPTPSQAVTTSGADGADMKSTEDDRNLCNLFRELATERNSKFKVKSRSRWTTDMRLLRAVDGNSPEEIEQAIRWVFKHPFWGGVIQSPGNLRQQFSRIWDQMNGNVIPIARKETPSEIWLAINGTNDDVIEGNAS